MGHESGAQRGDYAGDRVWSWGLGFEEMEGVRGKGENAKESKSRGLIRLLVLPLAGL